MNQPGRQLPPQFRPPMPVAEVTPSNLGQDLPEVRLCGKVHIIFGGNLNHAK